MDPRSSCPSDLFLENVKLSNVKLGGACHPTRATYESEATGGLRCAVKKFTDLHSSDQSGLFGAFIAWSKQWSDLRHPNLQQMIGVCVDTDGIPGVVTELQPFNLISCLEMEPSQCVKYSILLDVARGLQYLHTRNPPIAHRKVTAGNILVTSGLQARLTDPAMEECATPTQLCDIQADVSAFGRIIHQIVCSNTLEKCISDKKEPQGNEQNHNYSASLHNLSLKCLCEDGSQRPSIHVIVEEIKLKAATNAHPTLVIPGEELSSAKAEKLAITDVQIAALNRTIKAQEETLMGQQQDKIFLVQELECKSMTIEAQKDQIEHYKQLLQAKDTELQAQQQVLNIKQGQLKIKEREVACNAQDLTSKESLLALANTRIRALEHQLQILKNKVTQPASPLLSVDNVMTQATNHHAYGDGEFEEAQLSVPPRNTAVGQEVASGTEQPPGGPDVLNRRVRSRSDRLTTLNDGITVSDWMMVKGVRDKDTTPPEDTEPKLTSLLARQLKKIDENVEGQTPDQGGTTTELSQPSGAVAIRRKKSTSHEVDPQLQKLLNKRRSMAELESETA